MMRALVDKLCRTLFPSSLRSHLILLVIVAFLPLLAFAVVMVVLSARSERAIFERGATERTRALITALDAELRSSITPLEALATSRHLDSDDLSGFYDEAARVLKSQSGWLTVNLALPSGQVLLDLLRPLGVQLDDIAEQRSFNQVLKTGRAAVGNSVFGRLTHQHDFRIRVPVMRKGVIRYVLTAVIDTRSINALLSPQRLPPNWVGVVLDGNRRIVARTVDPESTVGNPASASLRAALDRSVEGWFHGSTVEGWEVYTPYSRSSFSGWAVALGIPADIVDATLRRSLTYLVPFGGGLFALSLLIAWFLSTRTAASISSLALMARELGAGKNPTTEIVPSRIAEVEAVRDAFVTANRLLRERSEEKDRIAVRLELALNSGSIGVHEWHPQTNELIWDDRVRAQWGLSPAAPIDHRVFLQAIHPDDRLRIEAALNRTLDPMSDGQYQAEFRVIGVEDHVERWIEARGQVVVEDGQALSLTGTTIDVTQRKAFQGELERQVQERTAMLQESLAELEAFSYSLSHDMRAPLRAMEGYAKALLADYHDRLDPEARHWLERICRSSHRLDALVKDVLAYSRVAKEEIELSTLDLEALVEDILSTTPEFQAPHARVVLDKPLHRVVGHEAYLTQCVTNLLGNAVKFVAEDTFPEIHIRSERLDGKVLLWFEDNGIGIDPVHQERIFQIFGQVYPEDRYSGTGIGLAIVRKAVQRMNGQVGVESKVAAGSRFWIMLSGENHDG